MPVIQERIRGLRVAGIAATFAFAFGSGLVAQERPGAGEHRTWPVVTSGWAGASAPDLSHPIGVTGASGAPMVHQDRNLDGPKPPVSGEPGWSGQGDDGPGGQQTANGCDRQGGVCNSTVPEPSTMGLLAIGLLGIALAGLRQRRA